MTDLINFLPEIITYIVLGFIFINSYKFTKINKPTEDFNSSFFEIIVSGFILTNFLRAIPLNLSYYWDLIGMVFFSALCGFGLAKFIKSSKFNVILKLLNISHRAKETMWQDIKDDDFAICAEFFDYENGLYYFGKVIKYECFERQPLILLSNYIHKIGKTEIANYEKEKYPVHTILIDTAKFQDIHITYQNSSNKPKEWESKTSISKDENQEQTTKELLPTK